MDIIRIPILFRGSLNDRYLCGLFDTKANYSLMRKGVAEQLEILILLRHRYRTINYDGASSKAEYAVCSNFIVSNNVEISDEFFVVDDLSEEVVIGTLTMRKWRMKLDFEHDRVEVDPRMAKMQIVQIK